MQILHEPAYVLSLVFSLALIASLLVKFWLATRQLRHVSVRRSSVPARFAQHVGLAAHQRAADYTLTKGRLGMVGMALGSALLLGWTLLGGLEALNVAVRDTVQPMLGDMAYQLALLTTFALIAGLLDLPLDAFSTFRIEAHFGFNRTTWRLYAFDLLKNVIVGALIGLPIAALILWLMNAAGAFWWLWAWGVWMGFNLLILVLYPTVIAPLFNKFEPLADESLRVRVQALMARCGLSAKGLFVMDGSKRSSHANAYFTGLGAAKRVVFFDTLLTKLNPGEVEAVLAHELGHFKHHHVLKRAVAMFVISLLGFALLGWLSRHEWFFTGLGVQPNLDAPNDALALLLFALALPVFLYFGSPLLAQLSRRHEFEADAYACALSSSTDLAQALLKLHEDNAATLTPDPLYAQFYYSHPPVSERLSALQNG